MSANPPPAADPRNSAQHEEWARYYALRSIDEHALNAENLATYEKWRSARAAAPIERSSLMYGTWWPPSVTKQQWRDHNLAEAEHHARLARILHGLEEMYRRSQSRNGEPRHSWSTASSTRRTARRRTGWCSTGRCGPGQRVGPNSRAAVSRVRTTSRRGRRTGERAH